MTESNSTIPLTERPAPEKAHSLEEEPIGLGELTRQEGFRSQPLSEQKRQIQEQAEALGRFAVATGYMPPTDVARYFVHFVDQFWDRYVVDLAYEQGGEPFPPAGESPEPGELPVNTGDLVPIDEAHGSGVELIHPWEREDPPPLPGPASPKPERAGQPAPDRPPSTPPEPVAEVQEPEEPPSEPEPPARKTNRAHARPKRVSQKVLKQELEEVETLKKGVLDVLLGLGATDLETVDPARLQDLGEAYEEFIHGYLNLQVDMGRYTRSWGWLLPLNEELHNDIQGMDLFNGLDQFFGTDVHHRLYAIGEGNVEAADHAVRVAENVRTGMEVTDTALTVASLAAGPGAALVKTGAKQGLKAAAKEAARYAVEMAADEAVSLGKDAAVNFGVDRGWYSQEEAEQIRAGLDLVEELHGRRKKSTDELLGVQGGGGDPDPGWDWSNASHQGDISGDSTGSHSIHPQSSGNTPKGEAEERPSSADTPRSNQSNEKASTMPRGNPELGALIRRVKEADVPASKKVKLLQDGATQIDGITFELLNTPVIGAEGVFRGSKILEEGPLKGCRPLLAVLKDGKIVKGFETWNPYGGYFVVDLSKLR